MDDSPYIAGSAGAIDRGSRGEVPLDQRCRAWPRLAEVIGLPETSDANSTHQTLSPADWPLVRWHSPVGLVPGYPARGERPVVQ
jgi:hypothetical protein